MVLSGRLNSSWPVEKGYTFAREVESPLSRVPSLTLPMYFLSLFPLPASVGFRVEKLQRDFLLEGISDEFKYYLVSWSKVCTLISEGGMGIRDLVMFNRALLGKWLWRYGIEREAWWRIAMD
jgi:hypothetical protein